MFNIEKKGKSQIKSRNIVKVFKFILQNGPVSRTEIEKQLKISMPSISRIVSSLLDEKLILEVGTEETDIGRKPINLIVNINIGYIVGVSISRSKLYITINNLKLDIIYREKIQLVDIETNEDLLEAVNNVIKTSLKEAKIDKEIILGIAVATRGAVDYNKGVILHCNLEKHFVNIPVKEYLENIYNCKVAVENNINAILFGDFFIANQDYNNEKNEKKDLVYIYIGEGVGGSIVCNNQLVRGRDNIAGLIGHMTVEKDGELCNCGKKGHLEAYASNIAIEKKYEKKLGLKKDSITIIDICKKANDKNELCIDILDNALEKLAIAISNIQVVINPDAIILTGEIFDYYDGAIKELQEKVSSYSFEEKLKDVMWIKRDKKNVMIEHFVAAIILDDILSFR